MHRDIFSFLHEVREIYLETFKDFNKEVNLKNIRSDKILNDGVIFDSFKEVLDDYLEKIDIFQMDVYQISLKYPELNITMRKKNYDSIMSKLYRNKDKKNYIIKILNDLLGTRCIVNNYLSIVTSLKETCDTSMFRFVDKTANESIPYKAWHIYIKGIDNFLFYIELQIWDRNHVETNLESHKEYKIKYIQAPVYYRGGEADES